MGLKLNHQTSFFLVGERVEVSFYIFQNEKHDWQGQVVIFHPGNIGDFDETFDEGRICFFFQMGGSTN